GVERRRSARIAPGRNSRRRQRSRGGFHVAMKILGSLTNRIFLASAALAVVSIASAVYFVSRTTTREAEAELQRGLIEAGTLVDQQTASLVQSVTVMARLVAALPRLTAGVADTQ